MIIRCSWCKRFQGSRPPFGGKYDKQITDGICEKCLDKHFPNIAETVEAILNEPETQEDRLAKGRRLIEEASVAIAAGRVALNNLRRSLRELSTTETIQNELGISDGITEVAEAKLR